MPDGAERRAGRRCAGGQTAGLRRRTGRLRLAFLGTAKTQLQKDHGYRRISHSGSDGGWHLHSAAYTMAQYRFGVAWLHQHYPGWRLGLQLSGSFCLRRWHQLLALHTWRRTLHRFAVWRLPSADMRLSSVPRLALAGGRRFQFSWWRTLPVADSSIQQLAAAPPHNHLSFWTAAYGCGWRNRFL